MRFFPAEKFIIAVSLVLFFLDALLAAYKGVGIDVITYTIMLVFAVFGLGMGQFFRLVRPSQASALACTASGLYVILSMSMGIFIFLLLPNHNPMIDPLLIRIDAALGYSWTGFVVWTAQWPWLGNVLRVVYLSSLIQIFIVIYVLSFNLKRIDLHLFQLTGVWAGLLTLCFWSFFPSSGASGWEVLPVQAQGALPIIVDSQYGMSINKLLQDGVTYISPKIALGLVGFPSFHTVIACLCVWYMAQFKRVFPIFLIVNLIMVPAILVQGGHHLMDILGGLAVFAIATVLARRTLAHLEQRTFAIA